MAEENQTKKFSMEELRKKYPRAGMKWDAEEDGRLKKLYEEKRAAGFGNFDMFVAELTRQFGRAAGGLKARLAMHFPDVPGWNYERDRFRVETLDKQAEAKLSRDHDAALKEAYEKYAAAKNETYAAFLKRMSARLGTEGKIISHRLAQLAGTVEKYGRDDVDAYGSRAGSRPQLKKEIPAADFSGNPEAREALRIMDETGDNLFLTGEAGTGKSTLLSYFRAVTKKNAVVLAPTGVAALNVEGQTIHSFCGFGPDITLAKVKKLGPWSPKIKLLQKLHTVVIDEISMVRADLLDCVDKFLRLNGPMPSLPFGGIQMVFIGDLYQLPPVEKDFQDGGGLLKQYQSAYFFDSRAFKSARFLHVRLRQIYRQQDRVFIDVLNAIRNNAATQEHLTVLNGRAQTGDDRFTFEKFAVYLTTTNRRARQVNDYFLQRLPGELKTFSGAARGSFQDRELPTDLELQAKIGAQVMMLNNDGRKRWVNGTMGKIVGFGDDGHSIDEEKYISMDEFEDDTSPSSDPVIVELETGERVHVEPYTWEMFQFVLDKRTDKIDSRTTGTFTQYPFKMAWAVTIHKAQGKTFDKVYIDLSTGTFAHGQLYVALSRCRTLNGIYLRRPIMPSDILLDRRIVDFLSSLNPAQI